MRLSVLALFIALPAAAYAAVCPQQQDAMDYFQIDCAERGQWCNDSITCCGRLQCLSNGFSRVGVTFALIHVGH